MKKLHNYKKLDVWIKSRALVGEVYTLTKCFPDSEKYGIISQIQRAVVSIAVNIAEGSGRTTNLEFSRFLDIAMGSAFEVETLLFLATDLNYISENDIENTFSNIAEIQKMLYSFKQYLCKDTSLVS